MHPFLEATTDLIGFLSRRAGGPECRKDHRYHAAADAKIGWIGPLGSREAAATFANISRGGAAIRVTGAVPPASARVRLEWETNATRRRVEAEVVGLHPSADGTTLVRLAFRERCSVATVEAIAGKRRKRRPSHGRLLGPECLEGRQLLSGTTADPPPAVVAADVSQSAPAPIAVAAPLSNLTNDPLLSSLLYSTPNRMASGIADSGAVGVNADWEAGTGTSWFIEQQRYGADFVQAGLVRGDAALVARGWKILDWGFARQAADGSFAGTGDAFHSTSMFVEAAARSLLLTVQSQSPDAPQIIEKYLPKLDAAARWLTTPSVMDKGDRNDAPYTHRRWLLAAAIGETAAVFRSQAGGSPTDPYRTLANTYDQLAASYAERGLTLQAADGVNPEKGGTDTSYQAYGILMAERYWTTCSSDDLRNRVMGMIVRGMDWLAARIDDKGNVSTDDDARTGVEASRSGTTKTVDYKTMIQAFTFADEMTGNGSYRNVARNLAVGRGWIK